MKKSIKKISYLILFCLLVAPTLIYGQGTNYIGPYVNSEPLEFTGKNDLVIEGLKFSNSDGPAITLTDCENVTIKNCQFTDIPLADAIVTYNSENVLIINNVFNNVHTALSAELGSSIKFERNDVKNLLGDMKGGDLSTSHAAKFNGVDGPESSISFNVIELIPGESASKEIINLYLSNGTSDSPIMVKDNWIRGGGDGIAVANGGGSYQIVEGNILVNPGEKGISILGGDHIIIRNNMLFSAQLPHSNIAFIFWNTSEDAPGEITVTENTINWSNADGAKNPLWAAEGFEDWIGKDTNTEYSDIDESILPEVILGEWVIEDIPNPEIPEITIYSDLYKRVSVKSFVYPVPVAVAEIFDATGEKIATANLSRFRTLIDKVLTPGEYDVKVTFTEIQASETKKITIN